VASSATGSAGNPTKNGAAKPAPAAGDKKPDAPKPSASVDAGPPFVKPDKVRGIYLTAWSAGSNTKMEKVYKMMDGSILNSVVIDVRDEGQMYWKTGIAIADDSKATEVAVPKPKRLFDGLRAHHLYPIARIACFRDNYVTRKHPERAIQDAQGHYWKDRRGFSWLDPYNKDNWEYLAQTVDFALDLGFPEIQLDYVRFPSEGKANSQTFPGAKKFGWTKETPEDVIAAFAEFIRERVKKRGARISADIFGIISETKNDQGIGQKLEKVAAPFDVISPMVYPSHYHAGEYGVKYPNAQPYEIIHKSLADFQKRVPKMTIRPWLQDFSIPVAGQPRVKYGIKEVQAQIKAAHDLGIDEYLMWNAGNRYTEAAYRTSATP
jgi:hypothetical protein